MPLDGVKDSGGKYFKFYIPGVGTPFPEVNDPDYSTMGLVGAVKGEDRINWALLRIIDVLMRLSKDKENNSIKLSEGASREFLKKWVPAGTGCGLAAAITAMKSSLVC